MHRLVILSPLIVSCTILICGLFAYRLLNEHDQSQLKIDEQMADSFDKLYPDNFRLLVNPKLLEGIVDEMKRNARGNSRNGVCNVIFESNVLIIIFALCFFRSVKNTNMDCAKIEGNASHQFRKTSCSGRRKCAGRDRNSATTLELCNDDFTNRESSENYDHNRTQSTSNVYKTNYHCYLVNQYL